MERQPLISVAHVIHHLVIGGMENGVVNLINRLPRDRFRHAVFCIEDYSEFRERIKVPGVEVHALHRSQIGVTRLRWQLFKLFRKWRPDIVHSRNLSGLDALLPARLAGAATLHSEHGFDVDNLDGKGRKQALLRRLHAPLVKHFVTVSEHLRQTLVEFQRVDPTRVTHICNGVDTTVFAPAPVPAYGHLLPPAFCNGECFVVGTVGRARPIKDQLTLVRAVGRLIHDDPGMARHLRLVVVGEGPMLTALKDEARQLGIGELTWFPGARHDVAMLMQNLDLFVLPSLNEGISNTMLEAMSTGIPTLATAVGGNVELIKPGETGATFQPGDVAGLAALLARYVTDRAMSSQQGVAAREHVLRNFSLQTMMAGYQDVYETLKADHVRHRRDI